MPKDAQASVAEIKGLPQPSQTTAGKKVVVAALLACIVAACLVFFVTRPPEVQEKLRQDASNLREEAAKLVDDATRGTPLAGSGDLLREPPPPPPAAVLHPSTNPGTLAGPVIRGPSGIEGMLMPDGSFRREGQQVVEKVQEDTRLKKDFVEDLADFIVRRYQPDARGGHLTLSLQSVNQHCGIRMNTEAGGGRTALMRYAFQPTMLRGLYHLYVQNFLQTLTLSAQKRHIEAHLPDLQRQLAQKSASVAAAVEAMLKSPDFEKHLADYEKFAEACENLSAQITGALFDVDQLNEGHAQPSEMRTAQLRVTGLNAKLRRSLENRDNALRHLLTALKMTRDPLLDDDSLLFLALWVHRRMAQGGSAREAVQTSVEILRDLAKRLLLACEEPKKAQAEGQKPVQTPSERPNPRSPGATLVEDAEIRSPGNRPASVQPISDKKTEAEQTPAASQKETDSAEVAQTPAPEALPEREVPTVENVPAHAEEKAMSPKDWQPPVDDGLPQTIQIPILAPSRSSREAL